MILKEYIIPTVGILIYKDDKVLLVKHGEKASHVTGSYGIPAGRIEDGESAKQAAVRELREETGLITEESALEDLPLDLPPANIKRKNGETKTFSITVFLCRAYTGTLSATDETIPEWIAVKNIDSLPLIINIKLMVTKGLQYS